MYKNKSVLAIIPARGGSKGIPLKNLEKIQGISLVGRAGQVANKVNEIDRIIISSDNKKIISEAKKYKVDAPFLRPKNLSGNRISDLKVLTHALNKIEKLDNITYDVIVMLQPTSPFRKAEHIKKAILMLVDDNCDSVWTLSKTDSKSHPLKQLTVINKNIEYYDYKGSKIIARQELSELYHRNGVAYVINRECLINQKSIKGRNSQALIIKEFNISIDTEFDLELSRYLFNKK
jgi:CMP-N,N'-diacetyllegionaminic acid synthase